MNVHKNGDAKLPAYEVDLDEATDRSTSYIVVSSIADLTGREPDDLEPLWDSVDPDALDSFVTHASTSSTPYRLAFEYQGYTVEIEDRWLRLFESEEARSSASV